MNLSDNWTVLAMIRTNMGSRYGASLAWLLSPTATITWLMKRA